MKQFKKHQFFSFLLALCMVIVCGVGFPPAQAADDTTTDTGEWINEALNKEDRNIVINISTNMRLSEQIRIPSGKTVEIRGNSHTIVPSTSWGEEKSLIFVEQGANLTIQQLTIDGGGNVRGIYVDAGGSNLTLESVTIQNCNGIAKSGAALFAAATGAGNTGVINIHASRFIGNKVPENTPTSGGAIYIGAGYMANLMENTFKDNRAHSGGAIYIYDSYLFATNCSFDNNFAGQRGGAIHDHGIVVLDHCTVQGNSSDQYGGGIYVSANEKVQGKLVLLNTSIAANHSKAGGGGVYLSGLGKAYLGDQTEVTGNKISSSVKVPDLYRDNNLQISALDAQIVACGDVKQVGISTANPFKRQVVAYGLGSGTIEVDPDVDAAFPSLNKSYLIPHSAIQGAAAVYTYDSDLWLLMDKTTDWSAGGSQDEVDCKTRGRFFCLDTFLNI